MSTDDSNVYITFQKNTLHLENSNKPQNCRKKLQDTFEQSENSNSSSTRSDRSVLSVINLDDTRKAIRISTERISKTFTNLRTSLGSFSQRFRMSTKRRQILQEGPMTPNCETPQTFSRKVLGRTPTKLYSPFSIESPYHSTTVNKENMPPISEQNIVKK